MTEAALPTGLTGDDFLNLPDRDEHRHAELIDGELVIHPPTPLHRLVAINLVVAIRLWARAGQGRGEVTMEPPVKITDRRGYLPGDFLQVADLGADDVVSSPLLPGLEVPLRSVLER